MDQKNDFDEKNGLFFAVQVTLWLCAGFAVVVLACYVFSKGWEDAARWGAFGDFVGGLLNPFFAFANLIVLVTISYQLKLREEAQARSDREAQTARAQYELEYGLKHQAVKELAQILNSLKHPAPNTANYASIVMGKIEEFAHCFESYAHLFPTERKNYIAMRDSLLRLYYKSQAFRQTVEIKTMAVPDLKLYQEMVDCYTTDFAFLRHGFIDKLRTSLLE